MGKIFVSYRRDDAPGDARSICEQLARSFGAANVFMDVDKLLAGQRFDRELDKALAKCDVLVAVIGSRWMALLSEHLQSGKRDYVRDEIAAALKRDIIVIPAMTGREANMPPLPAAEDLPENIRELVLYQKHNVAHESFRRDAAHLVAAIKAVLDDKRGPRPWRGIAVALAGAIALVLAVAVLGDWMNILGRIRPDTSVGTNPPTVAAIMNSDVASKKTGDEVRPKTETSADKAKPIETPNDATKKGAQPAKFAVVTECDRLAASPSDDDRPNGILGVLDYNKIDIAATAACDEAMRSYPDVARFPFQAGRTALARKDYAKAEQFFRLAIDKGSPAALNGLGVMYSNGFGVTKDYGEARKLQEKAAARGNASAMTNLGLMYEDGQGVKQDYAAAFSQYDQAAKLGGVIGMYHLGLMHENARGTPRDFEQARKWYEKAAPGYAPAMYRIGLLYENGRGVAQDFAEARKWYEKAAEQGNANAMFSIGFLYGNGRGVPKDFEQARNWYEKAAALGNAGAMNNLGVIYENARGVSRDFEQARNWYEKAAALGLAIAMKNLGSMYENARGVPRDFEQAHKWYEKAVALGNVDAMYAMGLLHHNGTGVAQDQIEARKWFEKAAEQGHADAMSYLGQYYNLGRGTAVDYALAMDWYEKSVRAGNGTALTSLYQLCTNTSLSDFQTRTCREKAAGLGNANAMYDLAVLYEEGNGVVRDVDQARAWYRKAADAGNENAKAKLKNLK